jgi:ActR/RegA family two-component response regulator
MSITSEPRSTQVSPNVLIVDDHDLVATSLALYLRSKGLHARRHAARSRDGILTATATLAPGVVLLDLDLGRGPTAQPSTAPPSSRASAATGGAWSS